ncbi:MAG TPA: murein biosynthesis integral membrane protein MurJ [Gemmatimonadaceae bacterium]|nr:murein biosynthesis integral membrane protein MurJ [Gemmatimonadaceae bacterium]
MRAGGARLVAAGILLSRIFGLVRQRVTAHYLGAGPVADAVAAAFRIPNLLQNLFGEGSLSASFIPVYAKLLAEGRKEDAGRVAGTILALLAALVAVVVLLGVAFAPQLVWLLAPGLALETQELATGLIRIILPGLGLLVVSAWCLGVLNAHRRFFLSYASPVLWNLAIIVAVIWQGYGVGAGQAELATVVAFASVVGSVLQLAVQVPSVLRLDRSLRIGAGAARAEVTTVLRNFGPAVATRGVVQLSAYADTLIASLLGAGALATLTYAQAISLLPVSLFGMSIAASELPAMSGATGSREEIAEALRTRLASGRARIAYFVIPSVIGLVVFGRVMASALYEGGAFTRDDAMWVWAALAGSGVGLLASTTGRLYASASFALRDTATPMRFATLRVALAAALGLTLAMTLPERFGWAPQVGIGLLTAASGLAAWLEYRLLRAHIDREVGALPSMGTLPARLWSAAIAAAALGVGVAALLPALHPFLEAAAVLGSYAVAYLALTRVIGADRARRA